MAAYHSRGGLSKVSLAGQAFPGANSLSHKVATRAT